MRTVTCSRKAIATVVDQSATFATSCMFYRISLTQHYSICMNVQLDMHTSTCTTKARCTISLLRGDERRVTAFSYRAKNLRCTMHGTFQRNPGGHAQSKTVREPQNMCHVRLPCRKCCASLVAEVELGSFPRRSCDSLQCKVLQKMTVDHIARRSSRRRNDNVHRA